MKKLKGEKRKQWIMARARQYMERDGRLGEEKCVTEATAEILLCEIKAGFLTRKKKKVK